MPVTLVDEFVVLLDDSGAPVGAERKVAVHHESTPLHLAFSLYLFNAAGELLLTRRALGKKTWPGVWTNSCCGHPAPGEALADAVRRRLQDELGLDVTGLECTLPGFAYRARDASGIWENEVCPVFVGHTTQSAAVVRPNAAEVAEFAWVRWADIRAAVAATPFAFSPWAVTQIGELGQVVEFGGPTTTVARTTGSAEGH